MTENDLLRASPAKLAELARFYGLRKVGHQGVYWVRKAATHPLTKKPHQLKWSTQTADVRTALLRAVPRVEAFLAKIQTHLEAPVRSSSGVLTLLELRAAYYSAPTVRASPAVRKRNWQDLERILRLVHGADLELERAAVGLVNRELAKEYQRRRLAQVIEAAAGDKLAVESGKRAINSTLAHAQSVFSRAALEDYHELRLPPSVRDFADALPVAARPQEEPSPLTDAQVHAMQAKLEDLKAGQPGAWVAFQLMLWGGLRNVDCLHARRSWLSKEDAGYRIKLAPTADYTPKGRSGSVVIPHRVAEQILALPIPAGAKLVELPTDGRPADPYLVPAAHKSARWEACYRELNAWLKAQGVAEDGTKVAYRLRRYYVAKVREQQGLAMAQLAARHADSATTEKHYTGRARVEKPIAL